MRTLVMAGLLATLSSAASAEIWECVDESGNKRFTNIKTEAKGCKLLSLGPPNTITSPKPQATTKAAPTPPPAGFPKVDAQTQRERDVDRRRILEQELANEQKLLAQSRKELDEQESIRLGNERNYQRVLDRLEPYKKKVKLHEDNVANLKRELGNAR
ncbi:MAG: DUF4124 domain-containing protein [Betaproteobacteria bacterium]|nr:DUF4124 domain-containing protein [Betaproteobacteria bacterium]